MPHNDYNIDNINNQDSNYRKTQKLLHVSWKLEITPLARRFLYYQIDQQYGYLKEGEIKEYDSFSMKNIAKQFNMNNYQSLSDAVDELESMNIMFVDRYRGSPNKYDINEDLESWVI